MEVRTQTKLVTPDFPEQLKSRCPIKDRGLVSVADVGLIFADYVEGYECTGDRLDGLVEIADKAQKDAEQHNSTLIGE